MDKALALIPRSIEEATSLAERLSKAQTLALSLRGKPADVLAAILAGQEMGLAPMAALRLIHIVDGKPVLAADAMVALILASGKAKFFRRAEVTSESVTYETQRHGDETVHRCTWSLAMAKLANLAHKDNWRKHPRSMLAARAKSELARDVYPDVLAGCYTPDEAETFAARSEPITPAPGEPDAMDAEIVESTPPPGSTPPPDNSYLNEIDAAPTTDALQKLSLDPRKPAKGSPGYELARAKYFARAKALSGAA